jgi:hypothetical protein
MESFLLLLIAVVLFDSSHCFRYNPVFLRVHRTVGQSVHVKHSRVLLRMNEDQEQEDEAKEDEGYTWGNVLHNFKQDMEEYKREQEDYNKAIKAYEDHMESFLSGMYFPTPLPLEIIGMKDSKFVRDMLKIISEVLGTPTPIFLSPTELKVENVPDNEKLVSMQVAPQFISKSQYYKCKEKLKEDWRVQEVFLRIGEEE